jgi:hypothetical protein
MSHLKLTIMKKFICSLVVALFTITPVFAQGSVSFTSTFFNDFSTLTSVISNTTGSAQSVTFEFSGNYYQGYPNLLSLPYAFYYEIGNESILKRKDPDLTGTYTVNFSETITIPPGNTNFMMKVVNVPSNPGFISMTTTMFGTVVIQPSWVNFSNSF